eukprot:GEZU01014783.1.p1 GENE.GEZU01014783.1~~GEZU01014783.1.p1  ORF type:complete len:518 (+),score=119.50 GEZU01014783.1:24-1577(+)
MRSLRACTYSRASMALSRVAYGIGAQINKSNKLLGISTRFAHTNPQGNRKPVIITREIDRDLDSLRKIVLTYHGFVNSRGQFDGIGISKMTALRLDANNDSDEGDIIQIYSGEWKNGKRHGLGMRNESGDFFAGEFMDDLPHGVGVRTNIWDGIKMEARWDEGKVDGLTITSKREEGAGPLSGNVCEVVEMDAAQQEPGKDDDVYFIVNKTKEFVYEGEVREDARCGFGRLFTEDFLYIGQFQNNQFDGYGVMITRDGEAQEGFWKNMQPEGYIEFMKQQQQQELSSQAQGQSASSAEPSMKPYWSGTIQNGCRNGYGVLVEKDGTVFEGEWVDDRLEGFGMARYPDGSVYKGHFKNHLRNGLGTLWQAVQPLTLVQPKQPQQQQQPRQQQQQQSQMLKATVMVAEWANDATIKIYSAPDLSGEQQIGKEKRTAIVANALKMVQQGEERLKNLRKQKCEQLQRGREQYAKQLERFEQMLQRHNQARTKLQQAIGSVNARLDDLKQRLAPLRSAFGIQ